jgi:hypothetical protein
MPTLLLLLAVLLPVPVVHVALAVTPGRGLPPAVERAAIAEAAAIWAPYGVAIAPLDRSGPARAESIVLTVVVTTSRSPSATDSGTALGAIDFAADGTPGRVITVFLDRLVRLLTDTRTSDTTMAERPRLVRERIIARAIGRVIAHEVGHFVLRSKEHTRQGLMGAMYRTDDLMAPGRSHYYLRP